MANQEDERQLISDHEKILMQMIYHNASRYLEALLGFYLTKDDNSNALKIKKMIRDLKIIYTDSQNS
tara:strand:- start:119 stop:319 length:201 start_codon:yes stop_codon:yes gene_type:complete